MLLSISCGVLGFGIGFFIHKVLVAVLMNDAVNHNDAEAEQIMTDFCELGEKIESILNN